MHTFTAPGDSIDPKLLHYWTFHIFKACYIIFRHYHLAVLCWNKQGCSSASDSSSSRVVSPIEGVIEEMQSKIRRLERWLAINTVLPNPYSKVHADFFSVWIHCNYLVLIILILWAGSMDISDVCPRWLFTVSKEASIMIFGNFQDHVLPFWLSYFVYRSQFFKWQVQS